MSELLPCPFCGATDGDLVQLFTRMDDFAYWSVECLECGCEIGDDAGQAEADKHWNTRAAADHITRLERDVAIAREALADLLCAVAEDFPDNPAEHNETAVQCYGMEATPSALKFGHMRTAREALSRISSAPETPNA